MFAVSVKLECPTTSSIVVRADPCSSIMLTAVAQVVEATTAQPGALELRLKLLRERGGVNRQPAGTSRRWGSWSRRRRSHGDGVSGGDCVAVTVAAAQTLGWPALMKVETLAPAGRTRPLLKWAGGETQLLDSLAPRVPEFSGRDTLSPSSMAGHSSSPFPFALRSARPVLVSRLNDLNSPIAIVRGWRYGCASKIASRSSFPNVSIAAARTAPWPGAPLASIRA